MRNDEEIFDGYGPYDGPFRKGVKNGESILLQHLL